MFILIGCATGSKGSRRDRAFVIGNVLYLFYLIGIGGDFMQGRFLTMPLLIFCVLFSRIRLSKRETILMLIFILIGAMPMMNNMLFHKFIFNFKNVVIRENGIADERGFYFQKYGLLSASKQRFIINDWRNKKERTIDITCGGLGFYSIYKGSQAHIIDPCGLTDPLLSRIPAKYNVLWRPGHLSRQLPTNYVASVIDKTNVLGDEKSKVLYESIRIITQGPILNFQRLKEIIKINLGLIPKPDLAIYQHQLIPCMVKDIKISQLTLESGNKICRKYEKHNQKIRRSLNRN